VGALAAVAPATGCSWAGETDQRDVNIGAPDLDAYYWMAPLPSTPGARLQIAGSYPRARYFSFHAYDSQGNALGSLYDQQIEPDRGAANPFRAAPSRGAGDGYTVQVIDAPRPAHPAANTLYAQASGSSAGLLVYRVYVPHNPAVPQGDVAFPQISVQTSDGTTIATEGACAITPPPAGAAFWQGVADTNFPRDAPSPAVSGADPTPTWARSFGNMLGNQQNAYLVALIARRYGELVVIHTRAPTFPDTRSGQAVYGDYQLRYWSICTYDESGQAAIGCAADYGAAVRDGQITYVVSDPGARPANATAANGVTWLPWGGTDNGAQVVYRNMLPSTSFPYAAQRIKPGDSALAVMGPYYPSAVYCSRQTFERGGWQACFAAAPGHSPPAGTAAPSACVGRSLAGRRGALGRGTLLASARIVRRRGRRWLRVSVTHAVRLYVTVARRGGARRLPWRRLRACHSYEIALSGGRGQVRVAATVRGARETRLLRG
jgi:hypothetical protein